MKNVFLKGISFMLLTGCLSQNIDTVPLPAFATPTPNAETGFSAEKEVAMLQEASEAKGVRVVFPAPYTQITSPLIVTGESRGTWLFEATMPVSLEDNDGTMLAESFVQAQGDWMTEDFVPFKGVIEFEAGAVESGYLVVRKANPSGLPEHDDEVRVPVSFR